MTHGIHSLIPPPSDALMTASPDEELEHQQERRSNAEQVVGKHEMIPISSIRANTYQPRASFDDESLHGLAQSIAALGVLQPILVRRSTDGFELIAGERRWRASQLAGLASIPAIVREIDDERSLGEALVENVQREDLNAIDEAFAFQQLMEDFHLSQNEIADRVGKSRASIANTIRLLQLPGSIRQLVAHGEITAGHGRALLMVDDADEQLRLAGECIKGSWSVRHLEAVVRGESRDSFTAATKSRTRKKSGPKGQPTSRSAGLTSTAALEVEDQLSDLFNTTVEVVDKAGRHQLVIDFADAEDLARIVAIVTSGTE
ncbi:MAG: ParB/RepB/Spo0J family partition protein [Acidimicrobiia bacterium]|nr:ParB/RepB/Spo0J family partition protein [Acidimicrobiia bacterium]